jgi:hypothetical protein
MKVAAETEFINTLGNLDLQVRRWHSSYEHVLLLAIGVDQFVLRT